MRVFLGGKGTPIPPIALPDPNVADAAVPAILLPENGEVFNPADYIPLGYTHYEVWCVGAVGGRGGDAAKDILWDRASHQEHIPDAEWARVVASYEDTARGSGVTSYSVIPPPGYPPPTSYISWDGSIYVLTPAQLAEYQHPDHMGTVYDYTNPHPTDSPITGGGGGGGGLQVVTGRLDELPIGGVPIVVGVPGLDGPPGQIEANGGWDSIYPADDVHYYWMNYQGGNFGGENWYNRYPMPHPLFYPPGVGGDGGYSAFGVICAASGGKGGGPSIIWGADGKPYFAGHGGDGGKGGRTVAGGGPQGALNPQSLTMGKDGVWDPNTRIGEGGGGGHGGMSYVAPDPIMNMI